jgi:hypothetical protein
VFDDAPKAQRQYKNTLDGGPPVLAQLGVWRGLGLTAATLPRARGFPGATSWFGDADQARPWAVCEAPITH